MLNTSPSHNMVDHDYYFLPASHHVKNEHKANLNELSEKQLLLKTLSSTCQINGHHISTGDYLSCTNGNLGAGTTTHRNHVHGMRGRGQFSHIYPSVNISNLNQPSSTTLSSSLDMSLRDLNATFCGSTLNQPLNDTLCISCFDHHQMQQSHRLLSSCANRKVSIVYILPHFAHTHIFFFLVV